MQLSKLVILFASCVIAFKVPKGQPEGTYSVSYGPNGTETHTLLKSWKKDQPIKAARDVFVGPPSKKVQARQVPNSVNYIHCGGYQMNQYDTDRANAMLDAQCVPPHNSVGPRLDFYSISGCVVSYFCNFSFALFPPGQYVDTPTGCWAGDRQALAHLINGQCGVYWAGWDNFAPTNPQVHTYEGTYGWENICGQGKHFCGRGV